MSVAVVVDIAFGADDIMLAKVIADELFNLPGRPLREQLCLPCTPLSTCRLAKITTQLIVS